MNSEIYITIDRLKNKYDGLTKRHKQIAQYLMENPSEVLSLGIDEFARQVGVSRASVFRFCRVMGLEGYKELQRQFAALRPTVKSATKDKTIEWLTQSMYDSIYYTLDNLDTQAFQSAVSLLKEANRIFWYGAGESGFMGELGNHRCWLLGIDSYAFRETIDLSSFARLRDKSNVFVFLSVSGEGSYLDKPLEMMREEKLPSIAITSTHISPLTEVADVVLHAASPRAKTGNNIVPVKAGFEAIINALLYKTALERGMSLEFGSELF